MYILDDTIEEKMEIIIADDKEETSELFALVNALNKAVEVIA